MSRIKRIKFKVFDQAKGAVIEIEGTVIVIPGFEQFQFVHHRWPGIKFTRISELQTSAMIVEGCRTKADAVTEAAKLLATIGADGLMVRIQHVHDKILGGKYLNEFEGQRELQF